MRLCTELGLPRWNSHDSGKSGRSEEGLSHRGRGQSPSLTKENSVLIEPEVVASANTLGQREKLNDWSWTAAPPGDKRGQEGTRLRVCRSHRVRLGDGYRL